MFRQILSLLPALLAFHLSFAQVGKTATQYYDEGIKYKDQKKYSEAIADFTRAYELNPSNTLALEQRATAYLRNNELDKACVDWKVLFQHNNARAQENLKKYCPQDKP